MTERLKVTGAVFKVRRIDGVEVNLDLRQKADESYADFVSRVNEALAVKHG